MAFAYMQRLAAADPLLHPSPRNVHRMLITGTMLAAKFTDDRVSPSLAMPAYYSRRVVRVVFYFSLDGCQDGRL